MKTVKQVILGSVPQGANGWKVSLRDAAKGLVPVVGETVLAEGVERKVAKVISLGGLDKIELEGDAA